MCVFDCSICIAEKEIRLCKNIAKFLQNLPFQLAKFCILDAKFEIFFCKKPRGQIIMVFWNELQQIINSRCNVTEQLALNNSSILLGLDPTQTQNKVIDQIILFAKQYIYNCKVFKRDIKVRAFLSILLNKYKVECILSHNAKDQINFMSNWEPYANLFRGLTS